MPRSRRALCPLWRTRAGAGSGTVLSFKVRANTHLTSVIHISASSCVKGPELGSALCHGLFGQWQAQEYRHTKCSDDFDEGRTKHYRNLRLVAPPVLYFFMQERLQSHIDRDQDASVGATGKTDGAT